MLWVLGTCTHRPDTRSLSEGAPKATTDRQPTLAIGAPCSRDQARAWAREAQGDARSTLRAANCYVFLTSTQPDQRSKLADARKGRQLAKAAVMHHPKSGLAHYLYAYLTGLEAENDPLRGLELVPVIEQEAMAAAELSPAIDRGGPDRMLGDLYLRAPGIPVSIGDVEKAVAHYRRAVNLAPGCAENRVSLAEALLEAGDSNGACEALHQLFLKMPAAESAEATWQDALKLLERLCAER